MKTKTKKRRTPDDADKRSLAIYHGALAIIAKHKALAEAEAEAKRTQPIMRMTRKRRAEAAQPVAFKLKPRVKVAIKDYRQISCGCCTGKAEGPGRTDQCVCFAHQDMPRGIRPKKCSVHRRDK